MPMGLSSPVPSACTMRPASRTGKLGASAPMTLPTTSSATVATNSGRVGTLR